MPIINVTKLWAQHLRSRMYCVREACSSKLENFPYAVFSTNVYENTSTKILRTKKSNLIFISEFKTLGMKVRYIRSRSTTFQWPLTPMVVIIFFYHFWLYTYMHYHDSATFVKSSTNILLFILDVIPHRPQFSVKTKAIINIMQIIHKISWSTLSPHHIVTTNIMFSQYITFFFY